MPPEPPPEEAFDSAVVLAAIERLEAKIDGLIAAFK
jgi:hypothetical protein